MEFKKIQLTGFKSFAEKTNFLIEEGLTGIVGPNGCGKSNIVESLRWCMGETSAKSMRGSGMEDVIFSGTSNKPSKNIAEVIVNLSNDGSLGSHNYKHIPECVYNCVILNFHHSIGLQLPQLYFWKVCLKYRKKLHLPYLSLSYFLLMFHPYTILKTQQYLIYRNHLDQQYLSNLLQ